MRECTAVTGLPTAARLLDTIASLAIALLQTHVLLNPVKGLHAAGQTSVSNLDC